MTVPPLFGWEHLLVVLLLLIALTVAYLVVAASTAHGSGRSEWQAELDARSSRRRDGATGRTDPHARSAEPVGPGAGLIATPGECGRGTGLLARALPEGGGGE